MLATLQLVVEGNLLTFCCLQAAGERAKLPAGWAPAYSSSQHAQQGLEVLATLQLVVEGAAFRLPHDCEFGLAVRASELWGKALGAVVKQVSTLPDAHACCCCAS